jgi:hypothetical protein
MPKTTIKHRDTGAVLWESEQQDLRAALIEAVGKRADLTDANLTGAYLRDADLRGAKLTGAYLRGADLRGADLRGACLTDADLTDANLTGACLTGAYPRGANLTDANLGGADLRGADLTGADLTDAYLTGADLRGACLRGAKINWQSHALLSEILWRAAKGEPAREQLAAWIGRKAEWCWEHWSRLEHPHRGWAMAELAKWVKEGDGAPGLLRAERVRGGQQG